MNHAAPRCPPSLGAPLFCFVLLACSPHAETQTPPNAPPVLQGVPRSRDAARARLVAIDASCDRCDGGRLGDEVSYECFGSWKGQPFTLDAVTTGAALPHPATGAGAMVEDLWVEVHVPGDDDASRQLLALWAGSTAER